MFGRHWHFNTLAAGMPRRERRHQRRSRSRSSSTTRTVEITSTHNRTYSRRSRKRSKSAKKKSKGKSLSTLHVLLLFFALVVDIAVPCSRMWMRTMKGMWCAGFGSGYLSMMCGGGKLSCCCCIDRAKPSPIPSLNDQNAFK